MLSGYDDRLLHVEIDPAPGWKQGSPRMYLLRQNNKVCLYASA